MNDLAERLNLRQVLGPKNYQAYIGAEAWLRNRVKQPSSSDWETIPFHLELQYHGRPVRAGIITFCSHHREHLLSRSDRVWVRLVVPSFGLSCQTRPTVCLAFDEGFNLGSEALGLLVFDVFTTWDQWADAIERGEIGCGVLYRTVDEEEDVDVEEGLDG